MLTESLTMTVCEVYSRPGQGDTSLGDRGEWLVVIFKSSWGGMIYSFKWK